MPIDSTVLIAVTLFYSSKLTLSSYGWGGVEGELAYRSRT